MAFAYVQGAIVDNVTTIALPSVTPTTGNLMIVVGFVSTTGGSLTISDTQVNSWTKFTNNVSNDGHGDECAGWWAVSKNSSATVITVAGNGGLAGAAAYAEYSGNSATPADIDAAVSGVTGTTATDGVTTASLVTTGDGDLIIACLADASRSAAPANAGTNFTSRAASTNAAPTLFGFRWEDRVQATHGATTPTYTDTTNGADAWTGEVAAFKVAASSSTVVSSIIQYGRGR